MPKDSFKYSNGEITVLWKPGICIHSGICWKGLNEVFNPRQKPWINMQGANTDRIKEQVKKCPSGALSYHDNDKEITEHPEQWAVSADEKLKVVASADGPYLINSPCVIVHPDGREEEKPGKVALCRCGSSKNKPYCDGTHKKIGFKG
jgi:uncharacterized Fe-S cluster protein YjdI